MHAAKSSRPHQGTHKSRDFRYCVRCPCERLRACHCLSAVYPTKHPSRFQVGGGKRGPTDPSMARRPVAAMAAAFLLFLATVRLRTCASLARLGHFSHAHRAVLFTTAV
jgi:hypothetical protein